MLRKGLEIVRKWRSPTLELDDGICLVDVVVLDWQDMPAMVKELIAMVRGVDDSELVQLPEREEVAKFLRPYVQFDSDEEGALEYARQIADDLLEWQRYGYVMRKMFPDVQ